VEYSKSSAPDSLFPIDSAIFPVTVDGPHAWGTTTSIGVVVYFKD
jgi:hypothetical protein